MKTTPAIIAFLLLNCSFDNAQAFCWEKAGQKYNIDPALMAAICWQESKWKPQAQNHANKDGSADYGLCQINSRELGGLTARGFSKRDLLEDPCFNVMEGARILSEKIRRVGGTWRAVGAYNAGERGTSSAQLHYAQLVEKHYAGLLGKPLPAGPNSGIRPSGVPAPGLNAPQMHDRAGPRQPHAPESRRTQPQHDTFVFDADADAVQAQGNDGRTEANPKQVRYANEGDEKREQDIQVRPASTRRNNFVYTF